jgi:hypothetical protein
VSSKRKLKRPTKEVRLERFREQNRNRLIRDLEEGRWFRPDSTLPVNCPGCNAPDLGLRGFLPDFCGYCFDCGWDMYCDWADSGSPSPIPPVVAAVIEEQEYQDRIMQEAEGLI